MESRTLLESILPCSPPCCSRTLAAQEVAKLSREELAAKLAGVEPADISDSPVPGVYEVAVGSSVAYVTADGRYIHARRALRPRDTPEPHRGNALDRRAWTSLAASTVIT